MDNDILVAENITKTFIGTRALDDVSVTIGKGEIRCLAGENGCGKSTFVKTVAGILTPDSGRISINGRHYHKLHAIDAINEGVQVIYQDLSLFTHMTVAENIVMNRLIAERNRFVNWKSVRRIAKEQLDLIGVTMDLNKTVGEISVANRQLVAICRALSLDTKILFMDEPTTALTNKEVGRLLSIVTDLKEKGLTIVFISHKLNEVFKVADNITIFRDGKKVGDFSTEALDEKSLVYHMTGRDVEYPRYTRTANGNEPVIEVEALTKKDNFEDISFSVREGDILGITGLLGSGRTELALSLFGLNPYDSGTIKFNGTPVKITCPQDALNLGIALLPEDRSTQSLFLNKSISENISSARIDKMKTKYGFVDSEAQRALASEQVRSLRVRTPSIDVPVRALSGGNQQKTVIAKWISTSPKLFILDTPTVGVDVGAKSEIYEQIHGFAKMGMAVILISDEFEEIKANCNKVLIMREGKIVCVLDENDVQSPLFREHMDRVVNSGDPSEVPDESMEGEVIN